MVTTYWATTASKVLSAKAEILRIHHRDGFDVAETMGDDALAGPLQHRLGEIDAGDRGDCEW